MTTATNTEVEEVVESSTVERCQVVWWEPTPRGQERQFQCNALVTHLLTSHDGANLPDVPHTTRTEKVCERCLNQALLLTCEIHDCPVVISWSAL